MTRSKIVFSCASLNLDQLLVSISISMKQDVLMQSPKREKQRAGFICDQPHSHEEAIQCSYCGAFRGRRRKRDYEDEFPNNL